MQLAKKDTKFKQRFFNLIRKKEPFLQKTIVATAMARYLQDTIWKTLSKRHIVSKLDEKSNPRRLIELNQFKEFKFEGNIFGLTMLYRTGPVTLFQARSIKRTMVLHLLMKSQKQKKALIETAMTNFKVIQGIRYANFVFLILRQPEYGIIIVPFEKRLSEVKEWITKNKLHITYNMLLNEADKGIFTDEFFEKWGTKIFRYLIRLINNENEK